MYLLDHHIKYIWYMASIYIIYKIHLDAKQVQPNWDVRQTTSSELRLV